MSKKLLLLAAFTGFASFMSVSLRADAVHGSDNTLRVRSFSLRSENEAKLKHSLSGAQLDLLRSFAERGLVAEGWKTLGSFGDDYGAAASEVIRPTSKWGVFSSRLVRWHWIHAVGENAYRAHFMAVARQHFSQYITLLSSGFYPNSREICVSYRKAVTDAGLPPITVFDGAWIRSGYDRLARWEVFSRVGTSRWADSNVFQDVSSIEAKKIIRKDFSDVLRGWVPSLADGE